MRSELLAQTTPVTAPHAWDMEFIPDESYTIKPVNGVFHIYKDEASETASLSLSLSLSLVTITNTFIFSGMQGRSEISVCGHESIR